MPQRINLCWLYLCSLTYSLWFASDYSFFFHLVPASSLLRPLGLDPSGCPFGSLPVWYPFHIQSYFNSLPIPGSWTCLDGEFWPSDEGSGFNLQMSILDAPFRLCSSGAYACDCGSQVANSLAAKEASILANWNMPQFPKSSPLLSLSAALQRLSAGCTGKKFAPRPDFAALSLAWECPLVGH